MKTNHIRLIILLFVFLAVFLISRRISRKDYMAIGGLTQGTTYHVTYESEDEQDLKQSIDSLLADFDMSLSSYIDSSVISRFNRNDSTVRADDKFITVFNKSDEVYRKTDGAFDITVAPVVDALGFGPGNSVDFDSTVIDSLIRYVGMDKVKLEGNKLVKADRHVMLDVNAIAQGYSVDLVAQYLENKGIRNYLVEIGGEVRAKGRNPYNKVWRIGIDKPIEGNMTPGSDLQAIVRLKGKSLATSGNYRSYYEKDGIKYVHTIDPKTGYPVLSNLLSATIITTDCMTADAYATAFMVFGLDRSIRFLKENDFLEAYLIYSDEEGNFQVYVSDGFEKYLAE